MPRVGYTEEYKTADAAEFPALKLNVAEKSRIWMPEAPWMEWFHRIEAPLIEHGVPVMEVKERKGGGTFEATKMDWVGSPWCLGLTGTPDNPGPLMQAGIDPANCPVCESAANGTGVQAPQQRFATNVIKYKVRPGTYDLITPISAEILVWPYTARVYATLYELQQQFGDLRRFDIALEMEDSKGADKWQRMKKISAVIAGGTAVAAHADPKVKAYLRELWGRVENRASDEQLRAACKGRDVPRNVVMDMVRRAEHQWQQANQAGSGGGNGSAAAANGAFNAGSLADGLESLINGGSPLAGSGPVSPSAALPGPTTAASPASPSVPPASDPMEGLFQEAVTGARQDAAALTAQVAAAGPTAAGATTTPTVAPAAENPFPTGPGAAQTASPASVPDARQDAVSAAADAMFGSAPAAAPAAVLTPPAPAAAAEQVVDFDDLFK